MMADMSQQMTTLVMPPLTNGGPPPLTRFTSADLAGMGSQQRPFDDSCPVCGDKVSGYHYGLLTCESCKGFFKRTVQNKKVYQCSGDSNCPVDRSCRKRCPHCRFKKCLRVGMETEAVREDRMRGGRNKFGPIYKRDRARRMHQARNGQPPASLLSPEHTVSSSTHLEYSAPPLNFYGSPTHQRRVQRYAQPKPSPAIYDGGHVQSPTLSSTHSPSSSGTLSTANTATTTDSSSAPSTAPLNSGGSSPLHPGQNTNIYVPNCDNLAALLSSSIDATQSGFASMHVKPEPSSSSYAEPASYHALTAANGFADYGSEQHFAGVFSTFDAPPQLHQQHQMLPCCQIPANREFASVFYRGGAYPSTPANFGEQQRSAISNGSGGVPSLLEKLSRHVLDEKQWQAHLYNMVNDLSFMQPKVDHFVVMCHVIDHSLFAQVDWARNSPYFKDLRVDDQMMLLQYSWAELHLLDHIYHRLQAGLPPSVALNGGHRFSLTSVALLGLGDLEHKLNSICDQLTSMGFDKIDYTAMKYMTLLNSSVQQLHCKQTVAEARERVRQAWAEYRPNLGAETAANVGVNFWTCLHSIQTIGRRGEEYLYFKYLSGNIPGQTLLTEMLSSGAKMRQEANGHS